jgi:hypothetical protein
MHCLRLVAVTHLFIDLRTLSPAQSEVTSGYGSERRNAFDVDSEVLYYPAKNYLEEAD